MASERDAGHRGIGGGAPSRAKKLVSFTGLMYTSGWRRRYSYSAVVPALAAPTTRKPGSVTPVTSWSLRPRPTPIIPAAPGGGEATPDDRSPAPPRPPCRRAPLLPGGPRVRTASSRRTLRRRNGDAPGRGRRAVSIARTIENAASGRPGSGGCGRALGSGGERGAAPGAGGPGSQAGAAAAPGWGSRGFGSGRSEDGGGDGGAAHCRTTFFHVPGVPGAVHRYRSPWLST